LNFRKNSHFYKTNHPGNGNNAGPGGLMEDPISVQITTFFAYMPQMTKKSTFGIQVFGFQLAFGFSHLKFSSPLAG
jgi:hypothetical protein